MSGRLFRLAGRRRPQSGNTAQFPDRARRRDFAARAGNARFPEARAVDRKKILREVSLCG